MIQARDRFGALLLIAVVFGVPAIIVATTGGSLVEWVFYGVLMVMLIAVAHAVQGRRYTTKKRTFVRDYDEEQR